MAVGFDTSNVFNSSTANIGAISNNFTIGSSLTNGAMVAVLLIAAETALPASPAITWNSVSMALIAGTSINDGGAAGSVLLFGLVAPAGGTHSLAATWTADTNSGASIGFWTFTGVNQTGGATTFLNGTTNNTNSTSATKSVTTASGDATVFAWNVGNTFAASGQTPTQDWQVNTAIVEGQHILSSGASDSYTATLSVADQLTGAGCHIKAAAAAAAATASTLHMMGIG